MGAGRPVEDPGQGPDHVVVVVEDLVVVSRLTAVTTHEDGVGPVYHDLPHVVVGQQRLQRPVAREVAEGPLGDRGRIGQIEGPQSSLVVLRPTGNLLLYE